MIVVADTSPINYLLQIKEISILPQMYERVLIPPAVYEELSHPSAPSLLRKWLEEKAPWLEIRVVSARVIQFENVLDEGESEAIELVREVSADRLIIDERAGRIEAERLGIKTIGTLGLIKEAAALQLLDFDDAVRRLLATNFYITPESLARLRA